MTGGWPGDLLADIGVSRVRGPATAPLDTPKTSPYKAALLPRLSGPRAAPG